MLKTTDLLEPAPTKPRDTRAWPVRLWDDPDGRSVTVGLLGVLIIHLLLLLLGPRFLRIAEATPAGPRHAAQPSRFNIHLVPLPPLAPPPPKPAPTRFVETNPNAPENVPDNTVNFGARNQQAAQEKAQANAHSDRPEMKGRTDIKNTQVVTGQLHKPVPLAAVLPTPTQPKKDAAQARRERDPLSGTEKLTGNDPNGFGSAVAPKTDNPTNSPDLVKGAKDAPLFDGADQSEPDVDPAHPRARPVLQHVNARPAVFEDNRFGTPNIGITANDSRFNNYGAYLERMSEAVQAEWDSILDASRVSIPESIVTIRFRLNSDGQVEVTEIIKTASNSTPQGTQSCLSALTGRAPYGKWTPDMVAALGTSQELVYTFYYEGY